MSDIPEDESPLDPEINAAEATSRRYFRPLGTVGAHVDRRARDLQRQYQENRAGAVSSLAKLRNGVGRPIGSQPEIFALSVGDLQVGEYEHLTDDPTPEELAAYTALTLFAMHQQSQRTRSTHQRGYSMGRSVRLLRKHRGEGDEKSIRRRFEAIGTATSWEETIHHARSLVQLLRTEKVPLDYGQFADDLLDLQNPARAARVRLRWGRDFYRVNDHDDAVTETDNSANDSRGDQK